MKAGDCAECGAFIFHAPDREMGTHLSCRVDEPLDALDLEDRLEYALSIENANPVTENASDTASSRENNTAPGGRRYHVIVVRDSTGEKTYMTRTPVTHTEGCVLLSKITDYPWRRKLLEEVPRG